MILNVLISDKPGSDELSGAATNSKKKKEKRNVFHGFILSEKLQVLVP